MRLNDDEVYELCLTCVGLLNSLSSTLNFYKYDTQLLLGNAIYSIKN